MKIGVCTLEGCTGHEAGRKLLRTLYEAQTGQPLPEILALPGEKPRFLRSPWQFSITHTPRHAFCVLSLSPVGIDAEELDRRINLRLAEKILSPGELRQFQAAEDPRKALLSFWVLKEAQAKLTGEGLHGYPNHTNFTLPHPALREMEGCLVAVMEGKEE